MSDYYTDGYRHGLDDGERTLSEVCKERDALRARVADLDRVFRLYAEEANHRERDALKARVVELEARADRDDTQAKIAQLEEFLVTANARVARLEEALRKVGCEVPL